MPASIQIEPVGLSNVANFTPVYAVDEAPVAYGALTFQITNLGNSDLVFASPPMTLIENVGPTSYFDLDYSTLGTITPGDTGKFTVQFVAGFNPSAGVYSAYLQINSNSISGVSKILLQGTVDTSPLDDYIVGAYVTQYGGSTQPCIDFGILVPGTPVTSPVITLFGPANLPGDVVVTLTPNSAAGYEIVNQTGGSTIGPGGTITFQIQLTPATDKPNQDDTDAVVITGAPGLTYPLSIEVLYSTPVLVPAYTLTDSEEALLLGFFNSSGQNAMLQAAPLDLQLEEIAFATRQYIFGQSPTNTVELERLLMQYERLGPAIVSVTYAAVSPQSQTPVTQTRTFDTATDGLLRNTLFDGAIAGDIVQITITVAANQGPLSMTLLAPYIEQRGEVIEGT